MAMVTMDEPAVARRRGWLAAIAARWAPARRLYRFVLPLRFSALALGVVGFAFLASDQGRDVMAAFVEDDPSGSGIAVHTWQRWCFVPLVTLLALQIWFWSRQLLRLRFEGHPPASEFPRLASGLPRLLGVLSYAVTLAALARVAVGSWAGPGAPRATFLLLGGCLVLGATLFLFFCVARRRWLTRSGRGHVVDQADHAAALPRSTRLVLGATIVLAIAYFVLATFAVQRTGRLGASAIVLLSMSLWVSFGSALVYVGGRTKVPLLGGLLLLACLVSPRTDNHVVPLLRAGLVERPTVGDAFRTWYDHLNREQPGRPHPVFIAAAEGGGIRAAYWAATVLGALADDVPGFREHLFAISGVSGGSLGAGVFDALVASRIDRPAAVPGSLRSAAARVLAHDALAPTLAAMMGPDFLQRFVPLPVLPDRARALEGAWEDAWRSEIGDDRLAGGFLAMLHGREGELPSLFLNGTVVETGSRIIASNLDFTSDMLAHLGEHRVFADTLDLLEVAGGDLRVSTAIHNSARFTYVSPAGTLRRAATPPRTGSRLGCRAGERCEHVIDGGYFENSGATTAVDIASAVRDATGVLAHVLVIRYREDRPAALASERWLTESLSPVLGMLNTRGARGTFAVEQLAHETGTEPIVFELLQHPHTIRLPLGWLLSAQTRVMIDRQMGPGSDENGRSIDAVAALLGTTVQRDPFYEKAVASMPPSR